MYHLQLADIDTEQATVVPLHAADAFQTPWHSFDHISIAPQSEHCWGSGRQQVEYGYLVLEGDLELRAGTCHSPAKAPAVLRTLDPKHSIANTGSVTARVLAHRVRLVEAAPSASVDQFTAAAAVDPNLLQWRPSIHGGVGRIATRHIWGPDDFASAWTFLDHAILAPGSSVGYHHHGGLEESFIVLGGQGYVTIDESCFEVGTGSVTLQGIGQAHGIYNVADEELSFIRVAVADTDGAFTTVDEHDDLTGRRP